MHKIWNYCQNIKKEQYLLLFLIGVLCLVILWPMESGNQKTSTEKSEYHLSDTYSAIKEDTTEISVEACDIGKLEDAYTAYLEQKLEALLSGVDQAGEVQVMITLASLEHKVVEKDTPVSENELEEMGQGSTKRKEHSMQSQESTIYVQREDGSQIPFIAQTFVPDIEGIVVIVEGAGKGKVSNDITAALEALFGLDAHKIIILKKSLHEG